MSYYAARSLMGGSSSIVSAVGGLVGEINNKYPNRDHASDGWIGDASHSARASDHNPDYSDGGIVRAVDIDNNGAPYEFTSLVRDVFAAVIGDPRTYYLIYGGYIYSKTHGFSKIKYNGSNPHDKHVHVSVLDGPRENDASAWLAAPPFRLQPLRVSVKGLREQFMRAHDLRPGAVEVNNGVGRIQHVLVHTRGADLTVDGICGPATMAAWSNEEREHGGKGLIRIPDTKSLARLSRQGRRFGLVA